MTVGSVSVSADRRLLVYDLLEAAQDIGHEHVLERLVGLETEGRTSDDADLEQLAATGVAFYQLLHGADAAVVARGCEEVVQRAEALGHPGLLAVALALRATCAGLRRRHRRARALPGGRCRPVRGEAPPCTRRCRFTALNPSNSVILDG